MTKKTSQVTYEFMIRDYPLAQEVAEIEAMLNALGVEGWRVQSFAARDVNNMRVLFFREV